MARTKQPAKKRRLGKASRQTRWAPFWVAPRKHGLKRAKHVHPSRFTAKKRNWRRNRTQA